MADETTRIERALGTRVVSMSELDGGMVGTVHRVELATGRTIAAKTGETPLSIEAQMLRFLDDRGLPVPTVLYDSDDLLLLSFVEGESRITPAVERDAAEKLASLHDESAEGFGFPFDTLSGPEKQPNPWTDRWAEFYADHRVRRMRDRCLESGAIDEGLAERIADAADRMRDLLVEPARPALIHGDVWETNLLTDGTRVCAFLDPACYYAHPEVELAYVDWTETFGRPFFDRYDELRGIDPGFFETRRFAYRVYPLLEHVLLFGPPYDAELAETIDRVTSA